ncbi:MAG: MFS transporter [Bryobacteraceae bacterium]
MTEAVARWRLVRIAWAGMFVFGLTMALLGAILPELVRRLALNLTRAGALFVALNSAMLAAQLAVGPLMDRWGVKPVLAAGSVCSAAGMAVLAAVGSYGGLLGGLALLGAGGGALNTSTNTLVADLHPNPQAKSAALNLLGVFFGVGALTIPLAIGRLLETAGLTAILGVAMAVSVAPGVFTLAATFPPRPASASVASDALRLARDPLVLLFGALLFFQSGSEFILSGYTSLFLTRDLGFSLSAACYLLAAYWLAAMSVRVLLSRFLLRARPETVVRAGALASMAAVAALVGARRPALAAAAVIATGAAVASVYPTVLGQAGACFPERAGTVYGLLFSMALAGGMTLPWLVGRLGESFGLRAALMIPILDAAAVFLLQGAIVRRRQGAAGDHGAGSR